MKGPTPAGITGGQFPNQPRQDPHRIPQQRVIGGMMNIGLDHGGVDPQLRAILQAEGDGGADDRGIDGLQRARGQAVDGPVERVVLGDPLAVEGGEVPQRVAVRDPFAQFPIIPVLHAHQDHRPEYLRSRQPCPSGRGLFQASSQIAPHAFNDGAMLVEEIRDALQGGLEADALFDELQIGETDLRIRRPQVSASCACAR